MAPSGERPRQSRSRRSRSSSSTSRPRAGRRRSTAITEIGALKLRGGELLGRHRHAREPRRPDPADDHAAHRHHRGDGRARAADRRTAADDPGVPRRRGHRRAQHPLRLQLPRRRTRAARLPAAGEPAGRHDRAGPPPRPRRRAQPAPRTRSRSTSAPTPNRCTARTPTRPRPPRCSTRCSSTRATLGVLGLDDLVALPKIRVHPSTAKLALTARMPRVPGVYLFRDRGGAVLLRRQGDEPRARGPRLLLGRRPPAGPAVAARDGAHRAPRVRGPARSRGPRAAD